MKASIIIPAWNVECYVSECLDSIQAQSFQDFECIIVDDGSTDRTLEICRKYASKDSRFKVFCQSHGGLSKARNLGLKMATGEWTYLVDADDRMKSECLNHSLKFADDNNLQMVFWNVESFSEKDIASLAVGEKNYFAATAVDFGICSGEDAFCRMLESSNMLRKAVYFYALRKDCLKSMFYDFLDYAEDESYTVQNLFLQERAGCLMETLYQKRSRQKSQTYSKNTFQKFLALARSLKAIIDWMDAGSNQSRFKFRTIAWMEWWIDEQMKRLAREWSKLDEWEQDKIRHAGFRERLLIQKCVEMYTLSQHANHMSTIHDGALKFQTPSRLHG